MSLFNGEISIEQIVNSLDAFKKAMYNVNYVNKLILQNQEEIIANNRYDLVINRFVSNKFHNEDIAIVNIATNNANWTSGFEYFSNLNPSWSNKQFNNPDNFTYYDHITKKLNTSYDMIQTSEFATADYLNAVLLKNPNTTKIYQFFLQNWTSCVQAIAICLQRDILDNTKWIAVGSFVNLSTYFSNADVISNIPVILNFSNKISSLIQRLETNNWDDHELIKNIWEYSNISNIHNTKCLYSEKYKNWENQFISDCFIPNSNIDMQSSMIPFLNDLYLYYPSLSTGELAFSTRNYYGIDMLSVCKIDTYNGKQCIKEVTLHLNKFFLQNNVIGDTIFNGKLQINDIYGKSVIETDNVTKNISIHGKVGINQSLNGIQGLLDIDNLSNTSILSIVDKIASLNNTSYIVVNDTNVQFSLANITFDPDTIPPSYTNDIVIFSTPINSQILVTDIQFIYNPSTSFMTHSFTNNTFLKIQTIVNEINRMTLEIDRYTTHNGKQVVMSFIEILNDTQYNYLCSIKAIVGLTNNIIYFVASITSVQPIMVNPNYTAIFVKLISAFSALNKLLNYSILVIDLPEVYSELQAGNSVNSFTKYVHDGEFSDRFGLHNDEYVICAKFLTGSTLDETNMGSYLFIEQYPERAGKDLKNVFLKNSDVTCDKHAFKALTYYQDNYGLSKTKQNFITHYVYEKGEKISFLNKMMFKDGFGHQQEYVVITGINLDDYISKSILSSGDNQITGSLVIKDTVQKNIFEVNTEYKKIVNMYNTGLGTNNPKCILDVNDSGLTDIINIIIEIAKKSHTINLNIDKIIALDTMTDDAINGCIDTLFIDPNTGTSYQQTKDNYFVCNAAPINDNPDELQNIYNWIYRNWAGQHFTQINDANNKKSIQQQVASLLNLFKTQYSFDNGHTIGYLNWIYGMKISTRRIFVKNDKRYIFGTGTNIGNYNIQYNNNSSASAFFDYMTYMNLYLQDFIIRFKNIAPITIPNYASIRDYISTSSNIVPPTGFSFKKILVDFTKTNYASLKVYDVDFNTQAINGINIVLQDANRLNKYNLLCHNIYNIYSKNNTIKTVFKKGDYGIINFEDNYNDFMSLFYCSSVAGNLVTLISIELQLNTVIQPSVSIKGDLKITGDTYFHDGNTKTDFISIDTNESFMGVGTNVRYANYSNNYITTTTKSTLSNQHFIVSGSHFPIAIAERYSEIEPTRDDITGVIVNYDPLSLELMKNRTTFTARRSSKYYTIKEMDEYAKKYKPLALLGPYKRKELTNNKYGPDINFEIQDVTQISRELGNIHMVIDSIDGTNIRAGFGINFVDTATDGAVIEREVMYINNYGDMNVNHITLGMDPTTTNNIELSATNSDLKIGNKTLTEIINEKINKILSIDAAGILTVRLGGVTQEYAPV